MGSGGGGDQHFCLRWDNFHSNIATSFEQLRDHEDFVDVTLACEGRTIKAHKVVLSACSPYFRSLLKQNPCQHPIIILRDVAFADVSALLSFVYQGEVYVSQERLTAFLRTAELLHIKGLTEQQQHHHHHPGTASTGPATSSSGSGGHESSGGSFSSNVAVSLLAPQGSGGASAPLNHLVATAPHPPHSPIEQGSHPAAHGVPRSPSPTRPPSSPSPPPPPPLPYIPPPSHHISPPPKKRRHQSLLVPPQPVSPRCSSVEPPPLSSCPSSSSQPPDAGPPLTTAKLECGVSSIMVGSTLAAALTAPRDMPVVKEPLSSPLLLPPLVEVKQEVIDSPFEDTNSNSSAASEQHAVNLSVESTGGSILRQRIQGYQGSPDAPPPPSFSQRSSGTGDEDGGPDMADRKDGGITPPTAVAIMRRQHMLGLAAAAAAAGVYTRSGGTTTTASSGGSSDQSAHAPPGGNSDGEGILLPPSTTITPTNSLLSSLTAKPPPPPLTPHLHLSSTIPTTTSSTTSLTTSSSTTNAKVGGGRPRYAGPRNCPHCGKRYSTIAALKYHVGLVHSVSDQVPCFYCPNWFDIRTDLKKHLELAHNEHS